MRKDADKKDAHAQKIMRPPYAPGVCWLMPAFAAVRAMIMDPIGPATMGGRTFTRKPIDTAAGSFSMPIVKVRVK